jgi:predicted permease
VVIVTLGLGIGSATAVFGMVNQLVLRPLPGTANSDRAAYLRLAADGSEGLTQPDFDAVAERATLLDGIASYGYIARADVSVGTSRPVAVQAGTFYGDFFKVLGVQPADGRVLSRADAELDADPLVAVISTSLREQLFGTDEAVVGRPLQLNGYSVEIVGVASPGFRGAERGVEIDAWLPHGALVPLAGFTPESLRGRRTALHNRLLVLPKHGASLESVEDQISQILTRQAQAAPESAEQLSRLTPITYPGLHTPPLIRDVTRRTLRMMTWAVALIFAIACANVANLLLFQNLARREAVATVRALGASPGRVARQRFVETLALGLVGGTVGLVVAWLITLAFRGQSLVRMPAFEGFTVEGSTAAFVIATALLSSLLCGVVPAVLSARFDLGGTLRAGAGRATGRTGALRIALSAGQIALTLALVTGGLLMVRTIANYRSLDTGLNVDDVVYVYLQPPDDLEPADNLSRYRRLLHETEAVPGVERAALDVYGPHGSSFRTQVSLPGRMPPLERRPDFESMSMGWEVSPSWFEVFGVTPIHGRVFNDNDWRVPSSGTAVITASLARRLFGRTDVSGETVLVRLRREPEERTVLGVVEDYTSLLRPSEPTDVIFLPFGEVQDFQMSLMVKASPTAPDVAEGIRRAAGTVFPDIPVREPLSLKDRVEDTYGEQRLLVRLLGILSAFGVLLSAVGLFGAVFFMVNTRRREFSIRRALGADAAGVVRLIARAASTMVTTGTVIGVVVAFGLARVLQSRLFGVGSLDPAAYVGAVGVVVLAAVLACLTPARAALRVDPVQILREP